MNHDPGAPTPDPDAQEHALDPVVARASEIVDRRIAADDPEDRTPPWQDRSSTGDRDADVAAPVRDMAEAMWTARTALRAPDEPDAAVRDAVVATALEELAAPAVRRGPRGVPAWLAGAAAVVAVVAGLAVFSGVRSTGGNDSAEVASDAPSTTAELFAAADTGADATTEEDEGADVTDGGDIPEVGGQAAAPEPAPGELPDGAGGDGVAASDDPVAAPRAEAAASPGIGPYPAGLLAMGRALSPGVPRG